ncbi:MAG: hypothetical protein D6723_18650 [Acidobacteria bacterium]|nr:MAG: hypothetical protein D6723_18650 [Acidobacteriota bacterium]
MKKVLALTGAFCSPMALVFAGAAVPKVLGILLALLQLGSNIGFGTLVGVFSSLVFFGGPFLPVDFAFIL